MSKTLYEVLGVDKGASSDLIFTAYNLLLSKCEARLNSGDMSAQNEIVMLKEAYRVLSDARKRTTYDDKLQSSHVVANALHTNIAQPLEIEQGVFISWWRTSKTSKLLAGTFVLLLVYLGLGYFNTSGKMEVVKSHITETSKNLAARAANEGKLVEGVVRNDEAAINHQAQVLNRAISVEEEQEARRRQELEYRANADTRMLEMQRREQDARLEMQRKQQEQNDKRVESQKADRETRYYTCLNAAIDRYGAAQASSMCAGYR